jgi:hypothetical protein
MDNKRMYRHGLSEFFKYIKYFLLQESHYRQKGVCIMLDNSLNRKIIHIDMDAFLCCGANGPYIARKAVAVGGSENRGVVAAASYEARKFEFDLRLVALWPSTAKRLFLLRV